MVLFSEETSTPSSSTKTEIASTTKPHGPSSNLGIILGCVIGGVVLIGIIFVLILVCYMRKRYETDNCLQIELGRIFLQYAICIFFQIKSPVCFD